MIQWFFYFLLHLTTLIGTSYPSTQTHIFSSFLKILAHLPKKKILFLRNNENSVLSAVRIINITPFHTPGRLDIISYNIVFSSRSFIKWLYDVVLYSNTCNDGNEKKRVKKNRMPDTVKLFHIQVYGIGKFLGENKMKKKKEQRPCGIFIKFRPHLQSNFS